MLPKRARVSTNLFDKVMKSGKVAHTPHFSFRYLPMPEQAGLKSGSLVRISAVASKKIFKTAVSRHAITRKIYRAVRAIGEELTFPPITLIIFAKSGAEKIPFEEVMAEIKQGLVDRVGKN